MNPNINGQQQQNFTYATYPVSYMVPNMGNQQSTYGYYQVQPNYVVNQPEIKMKTCRNVKGHIPTCGLSKPVSDFYSGKTICKDCWKHYIKQQSDRKKQETQLIVNQFSNNKREIEEIKQKDESKIKELEEKITSILTVNETNVDGLVIRLEEDNLKKENLLKQNEVLIDKLHRELDELNNSNNILQRSLESMTLEKDNFKIKSENYAKRMLESDRIINDLKVEINRLSGGRR